MLLRKKCVFLTKKRGKNCKKIVCSDLEEEFIGEYVSIGANSFKYRDRDLKRSNELPTRSVRLEEQPIKLQ